MIGWMQHKIVICGEGFLELFDRAITPPHLRFSDHTRLDISCYILSTIRYLQVPEDADSHFQQALMR